MAQSSSFRGRKIEVRNVGKITGKNFSSVQPQAQPNQAPQPTDELRLEFNYGNTTKLDYDLNIRSSSQAGYQEIIARVPNFIPVSDKLSVDLVRAIEDPSGSIIEYTSQTAPIIVAPFDRMLTVDPTSGSVSILNANDAKQIVDTVGSANLLLARIPLGAGTNPRYIASTSDRAYIPLESSNEIAIIDLIGLRELDVNSSTPAIDRIHLNVAGNAQASFIVIGDLERYAYVSDRNSGSIYVIDIDPGSLTYNKHVKTIVIPGTTGIKKLAVNNNGKYLFATTTTNTVDTAAIAVINIDLSSNQVHKWVRNIITDAGVEGITATGNDNVMLFTNRNDARGFGRLILSYGANGSITSNLDLDRNNPNAYTALSLGSINDYFDVNDARDVTWLRDTKTSDEYAFIAGFNGRYFGSGIPSVDGPKAGSNVGIIRIRPGQKPELVAATKPIPGGLTSSIALSKDNKYLYATNPGAGSTFIFDVEQIIGTIEKRGVTIPISDFNTRPIDEINTSIDIATNVFDANYLFSNYDKVRPVGTGLSWQVSSVYNPHSALQILRQKLSIKTVLKLHS